MTEEKKDSAELKELHHEAWPHFRTAFVIILIIFSLYLTIIFLGGQDVGGAGHAGH